MGNFEEEYMAPLQNMEVALALTYRAHEAMTDWETLNAVNGLLRTYTAEQRRRKPPTLKLNPLAQQSYDELKRTCDGLLGHAPLALDSGRLVELSDTPLALESGRFVELSHTPLTVGEVIKCLKRIRKSVNMWQKEGGQRGYFNFVNQFLPPDEA